MKNSLIRKHAEVVDDISLATVRWQLLCLKVRRFSFVENPLDEWRSCLPNSRPDVRVPALKLSNLVSHLLELLNDVWSPSPLIGLRSVRSFWSQSVSQPS